MSRDSWPTPPTRLPSAVLLDMDGTLIDSEPLWHEVEGHLVTEHGGAWSEEQADELTGMPMLKSAELLRAAGVDLAPEQIVERMNRFVIDAVHVAPPWIPGARELTFALKEAGVPLALVTSSYRELADAFLGHVPADLFDVVVTGDEVDNCKPHPEPYLRALEALDVAPHEAIAVEDSPSGLASTFAAGVPTIAVSTYGTPQAADGPPRRIVVQDLRGLAPEGLLDLLAL